jgi:hypothetical protein
MPGGTKKESELHAKFKDYHDHHEWYFPGDDLIDYIIEQINIDIRTKESTIQGLLKHKGNVNASKVHEKED